MNDDKTEYAVSPENLDDKIKVESQVEPRQEVVAEKVADCFSCDKCDFTSVREDGLMIHTAKKHALALIDKGAEIMESKQLDMNKNLVNVNVPLSNRFEILSTVSASPVLIESMNMQPISVESDPFKKPSFSSSPEPISCSPPRTPPGSPALTSRDLEEEIKAAIRGLSLKTDVVSEKLSNRWK